MEEEAWTISLAVEEIDLLRSEISDAWNNLSSCLVGMSISDPRWKQATTWLNRNRKYQQVIARLPNERHADR